MKHSIHFLALVITLVVGTALQCSGLSITSNLMRSDSDVPMYGKTAARDFTDSSTFTFPLHQVWEYDATGGFGPNPPMIIDSTIFFGTLRGEFHAVGIRTGKRIGYFKTHSPIQATPAWIDTTIIIGTESGDMNFFGYRIDEGEVSWSKDLGGVVASPAVRNDTIFVGGLDGFLYCFDKNGRHVWSYDTKAEIRSAPCVAGPTVYCASTNGKVYAVSSADGALRWSFSTGDAIYAGVTVQSDNVIVASRDSTVYLLDPRSGSVNHTLTIGNKIMAAPSVSNGNIYVSSLDGSVSAYRLISGEALWKFTAKAIINTTPIVTPSAVFVASLDKNLYALSPENGTLLWKMEFPARIKTTPLVWNNFIFIAAEDKMLYCLR